MARPRPWRAGARRALHHGDDGGRPQRRRGRGAAATTASDEERALVLAKAIAGIAIPDWEGVGDADGNPVPVSPRASTRCSRSGRSSRRSRRSTSPRACCWNRKKTPPRPRRVALRRGRRLLRGLRGTLRGLPGRLNRPQTLEGWQVWDLALRLGGQLRAIPGAVLGWDLGAASRWRPRSASSRSLAAELLPEIEAIAIRQHQRTHGDRTMTEQRVSVRLAAVGGDRLKADLVAIGREGKRALAASPARRRRRAGASTRPARPPAPRSASSRRSRPGRRRPPPACARRARPPARSSSASTGDRRHAAAAPQRRGHRGLRRGRSTTCARSTTRSSPRSAAYRGELAGIRQAHAVGAISADEMTAAISRDARRRSPASPRSRAAAPRCRRWRRRLARRGVPEPDADVPAQRHRRLARRRA